MPSRSLAPTRVAISASSNQPPEIELSGCRASCAWHWLAQKAMMLCLNQAARTEFRNLRTSSLRRLLSLDKDCAADSTSEEAKPVSLAPRCTSEILELTCVVPCAAC